MKKSYLIGFFFVFSLLFIFTNKVQAADVEVKNANELKLKIAGITEDTTITLSEDFSYSTEELINLSFTGNHHVTIDGNNINSNLKLLTKVNPSQTLTLKNFEFAKEGNENKISDIDITFNGDGKVYLDNIIIRNQKYKISNMHSIKVSGKGGTFYANNVLIENNDFTAINTELSKIGIININGININFSMINSTIQNNTTFESPTIFMQSKDLGFEEPINNNLFSLENVVINGNEIESKFLQPQIGTVTIKSVESTDFKVVDSYFNENKIHESRDINQSYTSGVFKLFGGFNSFDLSGSTFSGNEGGSSGVILLDGGKVGAVKFNINNNTFHGNLGITKNIMAGVSGVFNHVNLFEISGQGFKHGDVKSSNNTYYGNRVKINGDFFFSPPGGSAIHSSQTKNFLIKNDLFSDNFIEVNIPIKKEYEQVQLSGEGSVFSTLGFDNGIESTELGNQIFGKYPALLADNNSKVTAGYKDNKIVIPTVNIAPKMHRENDVLGIANMTSTDASTIDQRGFTRSGKADIGAVEISSLLYDANGGYFKLPELKVYDGATYYEGANPKQYASVSTPNADYSIINGEKILNPTRKEHQFLGWSFNKNASKFDPQLVVGKKVNVEDQQIIYAIWKENKYQLKYFNNGKTSGVAPKQNASPLSKQVTIKNNGKMKRKGYQFVGWSLKPNALKADSKFKPGQKMNLSKNLKLYAVWKRTK